MADEEYKERYVYAIGTSVHTVIEAPVIAKIQFTVCDQWDKLFAAYLKFELGQPVTRFARELRKMADKIEQREAEFQAMLREDD